MFAGVYTVTIQCCCLCAVIIVVVMVSVCSGATLCQYRVHEPVHVAVVVWLLGSKQQALCVRVCVQAARGGAVPCGRKCVPPKSSGNTHTRAHTNTLAHTHLCSRVRTHASVQVSPCIVSSPIPCTRCTSGSFNSSTDSDVGCGALSGCGLCGEGAVCSTSGDCSSPLICGHSRTCVGEEKSRSL